MAISTYTPAANKIVHYTAVDFKSRACLANPVHLMQYDISLPLVAVALYSDGVPYSLPTGASVNIRVGKRDGTVVYNPALGCSATRNVVYCEITKQMSSEYGFINAILELVVDGGIAGSSYIQLDIAKNPVQDGAMASSDEYRVMSELVAEAEEVVTNPPKIQNGYWWMWDSAKKQYVNTNTPANGNKGDKGDNGITPTIGSNGNWYLGTTDTGKPSRGQTGPSGTTPVIGSNGNWYLGTTDTGKPSRGIQGPQGIRGETGKGLTILGYYPTKALLDSAKKATANAGDAYGVGSAAPYTIYIFDGGSGEFVDNGTLQGVEGPKGDNGATPTIGENGNWFIDGVDTGKPSRGEKGDGSGDMLASDYDSDEKVKTAGGIAAFVKASYGIFQMNASGWSNKQYSFESVNPSTDYDLTVSVAPTATEEQYDAFAKAKICGNTTSNVVTALGTVPTINIPVLLKVVKK